MTPLSECLPLRIRWETLESNFQEWQSDLRGGPRRHPGIRQSGPVREHHPRSTLTGNADLDCESSIVGTGIRARRLPSEAHHAAVNVDCAGSGVLQPVPGAAESPARS